MQISQVLRRKGHEVATLDAGESVRTALALLAEHRIGALVVSADGEHIDGILSERDIARGLHEHGAGLLAETISSVMTAEVHTCPPTASVHDLAQTMTDHRVRHVPVVRDGFRARDTGEFETAFPRQAFDCVGLHLLMVAGAILGLKAT